MASVASNMYPERVGPGPVTRSPCSALSASLLATTNGYLFTITYRMYASVYNAGLPVVNIGIACGSQQAFRYVTPSFFSNDIYVCLRLDNL